LLSLLPRPEEESAMLVLSRKPGEKVKIGEDITLTVLAVVGGRIRLGIEAPDDVRVLRRELAWWLDLDGRQLPEPSVAPDAGALPPR
jgi:carbon storage regulator